MPWLDFEEHINNFRMQDTMFMERNGLFNSADVGVMAGGNLGRHDVDDYQKNVSNRLCRAATARSRSASTTATATTRPRPTRTR